MTSVQSTTVSAIGVGIDTSRYGHHVTFLRDDLQPATAPIAIVETREGYDQLLSVLGNLKRRHPNVVFQIRVDEANTCRRRRSVILWRAVARSQRRNGIVFPRKYLSMSRAATA